MLSARLHKLEQAVERLRSHIFLFVEDEDVETPLTSSNVATYAYDDARGVIRIEFHSGAEYEYSECTLDEFLKIASGEAVCVSSGENEYGAWWEGKTPSIGAAVYQWLINAGKPYVQIA